MAPGSDTANLSILGYGGKRYYRGRASLEALAMGICLGVHDLAFRCDLTGLSGDGPAFEEMQMGGPGALAGKEEEAYISVKEAMGKESALSLVPGRNGKCLLSWKDGLLKSPGLMNEAAGGCGLVPPHEMMGKRIGDFLPERER